MMPEIKPEMLSTLYQVAETSIQLNRLDEAAWCFERAAEHEPALVRPLKGLARVRHLQGRTSEARTLIGQALALEKRDVESHVILGQIYQSEGNFPAAIAAYEAAVALEPLHGQAQLLLALLHKPVDPEARITTLAELCRTSSLATGQRATLQFALAREYEASKQPDLAFANYRTANDIRWSQFSGLPDARLDADRLMAVFDRSFFADRQGIGNLSARPVFVVGMMRSGTTLVEQILASHPMVEGHGEMTDIPQIARSLAAKATSGSDYPECLTTIGAATIGSYAQGYLDRLTLSAPAAIRDIDKLPHNFQHLGLIALLFPNARIIHCIRDPLDTCLSNYFQDFGPQNAFTYNLEALGTYYRNYSRLMAHWQAVLPNPILQIQYEELVADTEYWSREAISFLDLPWNPECLNFQNSQRLIFTKSAWQARQPIYASAVQRWHSYSQHLDQLRAALGN